MVTMCNFFFLIIHVTKSKINFVLGCKVKYFPLENMSKILGGTVTKVISQSVSTKTFILEEDGKKRKISIYDYFVERYGRKDLHKDGPCLELNSRNYVPAEVSFLLIFCC